jgi:ABC-type branched-subunit amino acid transport system ATPase component
LATGPKLLLLDEVMAGLNPQEIVEIIALIRSIRDSGVTILLIEHKLREFMQLVSRVVAIDFGEIIAEGSPAEIVKHPRVIEAYIGKQNPLNLDNHA